MSGDLFPDLPETLSPREAWKRENGIRTIAPSHGSRNDMWIAHTGPGGPIADGDTEDEAIFRLASLLGIPTWEDRK